MGRLEEKGRARVERPVIIRVRNIVNSFNLPKEMFEIIKRC